MLLPNPVKDDGGADISLKPYVSDKKDFYFVPTSI